MLISIKRHYIGSGIIQDVMINTRYIVRVESTNPEEGYPKTRIVYSNFSRDEPLSFIYTNESLSTLKSKVSIARKTIQTED